MKRSVLAVTMACLSMTAAAQQRCAEGIYVRTDGVQGYASVHVIGDVMIAARLAELPAKGIIRITTTHGVAAPDQLNTWQYGAGVWRSGAYQLAGEAMYGACTMTEKSSCDASGNVTFTIEDMVQTQAGASWAFNCAGAFQEAITTGQNIIRYERMF